LLHLSWPKLLIPHKILVHFTMLVLSNIWFVLSRQIFGDQSKAMIDTSRRSYGRRYTAKVCSHCWKTGHVIDTCYRKHGFSPQFKFKNQKADCNNNEQNHESSRSKVHCQQTDFTPEQYQTLLVLLQHSKSSDNASNLVLLLVFGFLIVVLLINLFILDSFHLISLN